MEWEETVVVEGPSRMVSRNESNEFLDQRINSGEDLELLEKEVGLQRLAQEKARLGDTALHLAVTFGHTELAMRLVNEKPDLLHMDNANNDTPLHLAAGVGDEYMVWLLIREAKKAAKPVDLERGQLPDPVVKQALHAPNVSEDTAAHLAVRNRHGGVARVLVEADPELASVLSGNEESLLYLAAERDMVEFAEWMLNTPSVSHFISFVGPNSETALHAAAKTWQARDMMIFQPLGGELHRQDKHGNTALHYAAYRGRLSVVSLLCHWDWDNSDIVYTWNNDGNTPVHMATIGGHLHVVRWLIRNFRGCAYDTNTDGRNLFLIAIQYQCPAIVQYVLNESEMERLIYGSDDDGNGPLHIGAQHWDIQILRALLADPRLDKLARNKSNCTALDVFLDENKETTREPKMQWDEALLMLTKTIPRHVEPTKARSDELQQRKEVFKEFKSIVQREREGIMILATLVATVTFAAAFTVPGGYWGEAKVNALPGKPILLGDLAFKAFLISDTAAMCCSLAVLFLCVYAAWDDLDYAFSYWSAIQVLMWSAFLWLTVAFATGVYTTLCPRLPWLAIFICVVSGSVPVITLCWSVWPFISRYLRLYRFVDLLRRPSAKPRRNKASTEHKKETQG